MKIDIQNFDKIETGREPIPVGRYTVTLSSAEVKPTLDGMSKYIAWQGTVVGPTHSGRIVFWNTSLKETALWNLKGLLMAANVEIGDDGFSTEDALGKQVDVSVEIEEYKGKPTNRVGAAYFPTAA